MHGVQYHLSSDLERIVVDFLFNFRQDMCNHVLQRSQKMESVRTKQLQILQITESIFAMINQVGKQLMQYLACK